jgi:serine protease Do
MWRVRIFILAALSAVSIWGQIPITSGSFLGIGLADLDVERAKELNLDPERGGVEITRVQINSPAGKIGLRAGDVLLTYNGETVLGGLQLTRLVNETPPGRKVSLQYWRDAKMQTAVLVTARRTNVESADPIPRFQFPSGMPPEIPAPILVWKNTILGVECESLNSQLAGYFAVQHGILVRYVEKSSLADTAGLRAGDVIIAAGEHQVSSPRDLASVLKSEAGSGNEVRLSLLRDRKRMSIEVGVGE